MKDIRHIRGNESGFGDAYRRCALDLHLAQGGSLNTFVPPSDEWYLDERALILAWLPQEAVQAFIIYSKGRFFYSDTDGEVLDIWVANPFRRKGLARKLATEALGSMHGRVGLQVHAENNASLAFWQTLASGIGARLDKEARREGSEAVWRLIITIGGNAPTVI